MKRIVFKAKKFKEAADWDARQCIAMTPEERIRIAHAIRQRAYCTKVVKGRSRMPSKAIDASGFSRDCADMRIVLRYVT